MGMALVMILHYIGEMKGRWVDGLMMGRDGIRIIRLLVGRGRPAGVICRSGRRFDETNENCFVRLLHACRSDWKGLLLANLSVRD